MRNNHMTMKTQTQQNQHIRQKRQRRRAALAALLLLIGAAAQAQTRAIEEENVYIPTESADGNAILITGNLTCGSSIGVTKIKSTDSGATNHLYADDDNFTEVRTVIAKVSSNTTQTWALDAYHNNVFFDDTDKYGVWSFNYSNSNDQQK